MYSNSPIVIEPVVARHKGALIFKMATAALIVVLQLEELGEGGRGSLGLEHQDVGDRGPLHWAVPTTTENSEYRIQTQEIQI